MRSVLRHLGQGVTPAICLWHSPRPYLLAPPVVCGCQSLGLWRMGCWPCLPQCLLLPRPLLPKVEVLPNAMWHRQPRLSLLECRPSPLCMYIFQVQQFPPLPQWLRPSVTPRASRVIWGSLEILSCSCSLSWFLACNPAFHRRTCTFSRPPGLVHGCCLTPEGMLTALWVDIGASELTQEDWRAQSQPIPGLSEAAG